MFKLNPLAQQLLKASAQRSFSRTSSSAAPIRSPLIRQLQALPKSSSGKRWSSYTPGSGFSAAPAGPGQTFDWRKAAVAGAVVAGAMVGTNFVLNRETRGGFTPFERDHLNSTFRYTGLGLGMTALGAFSLHKYGIATRIMQANPWVVLGVGLVGGIGSMYACISTNPENHVQKMAFFSTFQAFQAVSIAPLFFFSPALLARAGLYTLGVVGSLAYVGATAKEDKYLYLGGPLLAGIAVVALSSLAPMILPRTALRTLAVTESLALYGGLAVFGGCILYDTQKILAHARMAAIGRHKADPVGESISLELDTLNIFVRMVQILAMQQGGRRR